jgi:hypothetical protein
MNARPFIGFFIGMTAIIVFCLPFTNIHHSKKDIDQNEKKGGLAFGQIDSKPMEDHQTEEELNRITAALIQIEDTPSDFKVETEIDTAPGQTTGKFFFWKPFLRKSTAQRFARHISKVCGFDCHVEAAGEKEYQVYFDLETDRERSEKKSLLKTAGINFNQQNQPANKEKAE